MATFVKGNDPKSSRKGNTLEGIVSPRTKGIAEEIGDIPKNNKNSSDPSHN